MAKINIKAKREPGFWRAGIFFTREGSDHDSADLTKAQLKGISEEPMLIVTEVGESEAERVRREKAETAAADKARREAEAKEKAEAAALEKANKDALAREKAATKKAEDKAAWELTEAALRDDSKLSAEEWAALPASDRVVRIELALAKANK